MTTWGDVPYYPMKTAPQNVKKSVSGSKCCSICSGVFPIETHFYRSKNGYRSLCKACDSRGAMARQAARAENRSVKIAARERQEKINGYWVVRDPTGFFMGFIRGYDFKYTLRDGGWPDEMIVRHKDKLYQVMGRKLYALR